MCGHYADVFETYGYKTLQSVSYYFSMDDLGMSPDHASEGNTNKVTQMYALFTVTDDI